MSIVKVGIAETDLDFKKRLILAISERNELLLTCDHDSIEKLVLAIDEAKTPNADLLLLDIQESAEESIRAISLIKKKFSSVNIIVLSSFKDSDIIIKALQAGANSFISKTTDIDDIVEAIFTVQKGGSFMSPDITRSVVDYLSISPRKELIDKLTERQLEIVTRLSDGLSYKMIGDELGISIDTVRSHIKKIYKELGVKSKIQVINMFRDHK